VIGSVPHFPVYLFDVDGTLLDSATDICAAIGQVLASAGAPPISFEVLRGYVGFHFEVLFADLFPGHTPEQMEEWIRQYRTIYLGRGHTATRVYPGVAEALAALGGRKGTATTKGTPTTVRVLDQFGLRSYFDHVQGTDGFPYKPAPDVLLKTMEALGAKPEECLMVGESPADMEAGHAAGIKTCAVLYGYGKRQDLARYAPDFWIDDPRQLVPART
jgi:HAD superfamily hydrolase (TIGR01509 family)